MLNGKVEIVRFKSASKDRDRWCSVMSYDRQFRIADATQRKACDPICIWDEHGSSCLSSTEDLSARRKILFVMRDLRYVGSPDSRTPRQSDDLIVYAQLDRSQ